MTRRGASLVLGAALTAPAAGLVAPPFGARPAVPPTAAAGVRLFGIMDEVNSDAFALGGGDDGPADASKRMSDLYEMLLGEIVFSTNDPRLDIVEKKERTMDPDFMAWLTRKVEGSADPEEKVALRDLLEMIEDTKAKMEASERLREREEREKAEKEEARLKDAEIQAAEGAEMSDTDVLRKAVEVDNAEIGRGKEFQEEAKKKTFYESEITPEIRASYESLLAKLLPPYKPGDTPKSVVYANYDQCDAQLLKVLTERVEGGDADSQTVLDAISAEQNSRIAQATERLRTVLEAGDPMRMEGKIVKLAREGGLDEAFLLLLEVNRDQARAAGATGPADLMERLRKRSLEEKDKLTEAKPVRLLRKLLRTEDKEAREEILTEAFTPKDVLIVPGSPENAARAMDGETPEEEKPMPEVPPPEFINTCKAVLLNFGNLDDGRNEGDLSDKIKIIASEAEVVATRIYGKGMSPKEQQDRAWKDQTTSIFDLETLEIEAERMGENAPWTNPDNDDILPGFDLDGRMKIGGS